MLEQITNRLKYLNAVGVGYLTTDRPLRTLSGGEAQRVALTKALGVGLVNTLYVLDEPSIGLHERDTHRLIKIIQALRDSHNSVVVVEHDESTLRVADHLIDIGPGAGELGVQIIDSIVVVEHNRDIIKSADWIIDLGPEAAADGGQLAASGNSRKRLPGEGISHRSFLVACA